MVLPFKINATGDLNYLSTQIADVLSEHLKKGGATIVPAAEEAIKITSNITIDPKALRQMAQQNAADRVIWGSFTLIGERFSLDASMAGAFEPSPPTGFNAQGNKLENLLKVLKSLSEKIGLKLFQQEIVAEISIKGNNRIESDAILRQVKTKVGSIYQANQVTKDIRSIYKMGFFDDLRVEAESSPKGKILTFHVKEKPTIRRIRIKENQRFDDDEVKENLTISTGAILNIFKVRSNIEQIEAMYKEKNYHQVAVDYKVLPLDNNQADIEFIIKEGPKIYVTRINFEGNKSFKTKKLKKQIQTSEKGFFFWITSSGDLDLTKLDQDAALLNTFYSNQGYIQVRVADPIVDIGEEGIEITFKIDEGPRFKVGKIDVIGDLIKPKAELMEKLSLGESTYYNREKLRSDIIALSDLYGVYGYAHADVSPVVKEDNENLVVDVAYNIKKNQEVYFENIFISGNSRTRDKVIRRQLKVYEKERFNGAALKRSIRNLYRLDYFEDIKVNSLKGSKDDQMVLKIDVTEKPTGMFTFGAGYSSEENVFLVGSITQRNFLGKGQTLKFAGQFGASTTKYDLSFTEPWLFDIPLSATIFTYDQTKEYDEYDRDSIGGGLGFSYPIWDYTRYYISYAYDSSDVTEITSEADDTIKELGGTNVTSSLSMAVGYDSRDKAFNPTEGSKHKISVEYAGLGGDVGFTKYVLDTGWYIPLFKGLIGFLHGKTGYITQNNDKLLPDYEKFYLGGINSMRGFDYRGIHLTDVNSEGIETKVGGSRFVQFNIEMIIPISEKLGLMGVVFYDAGNVYDDSIDLGDLRQSAGYGFRWFSPLAPIRIEYGKILDRREGEEDGQWEFTMGGAF
ncbi:MAG: outer membrane protein assembly factor BamA [Desulfobacteraceae bacterium]